MADPVREKDSESSVENVSEYHEVAERYEGKLGKKVVRKVSYMPVESKDLTDMAQIDIRLVPIIAILYLISQIDRANVGNAKIEGMDKDLGLVGNQYNIISTVFFVPYIIFGESSVSISLTLY